MSQTTEYHTSFTNIADIYKNLKQIIAEKKVFGPDAQVKMKNEPGYAVPPRLKKYEDKLIMVVTNVGSIMGGGDSEDKNLDWRFGEKSFGVTYDPQTKQIDIVYYVHGSKHDNEIKKVQKLITKHIDSRSKKNKIKAALQELE